MISTAWKALKKVLELAVEWTISSLCSWEEAEVGHPDRNKRCASSQSPKKLKCPSMIFIPESLEKSK